MNILRKSHKPASTPVFPQPASVCLSVCLNVSLCQQKSNELKELAGTHIGICMDAQNCGHIPIMPLRTRNKTGTRREKQGQARTKLGQSGSN